MTLDFYPIIPSFWVDYSAHNNALRFDSSSSLRILRVITNRPGIWPCASSEVLWDMYRSNVLAVCSAREITCCCILSSTLFAYCLQWILWSLIRSIDQDFPFWWEVYRVKSSCGIVVVPLMLIVLNRKYRFNTEFSRSRETLKSTQTVLNKIPASRPACLQRLHFP